MAISVIDATSTGSTGTVMVSGNMPAFLAYLSSTQNITAATLTKLAIDTKVYDTASCYNNSTYTFTPNVAGYYQITINSTPDSSGSNPTNGYVQIQKNGVNFLSSYFSGNANGPSVASINSLVYCNGSTDSITAWLYMNGGSGTLRSNSVNLSTFFQAFMVRAA
jgi:hypothetical protein